MFPVLLLPRCLTAAFILTLLNLCLFPTNGWAASLALSWVDNATNETGFTIERKIGDGGTYAPYKTDIGANVTTFTDTDVTVGVKYWYRIQAFSGNTTSSYSNEASATVPTPAPASPLLSVTIVGQGTVSSGSTGISCLPTCSKAFATGTQVSLTPTPSAGWQFSSWSGSCSGKTIPCVVTIDQAKNVTATFTQTTTGGGGGVSGQPTVLTTGTFRDGSWYYDKNGNSRWEGCANDTCFAFGQSGDQPVAGVWIAGTKKRIGVFRQGAWYLDRNGSQGWDGCSGGDACLSFGALGDRAVVGDWNGDGKTDIGIFRNGTWQLDTNGNGLKECGKGDSCPTFGTTGDLPVVGDWNGDRKADIGIFRNGLWQLDIDGSGSFDGCNKDKCITAWGSAGDIPVVGEWVGNGRTNIGLYHRGAWQLDLNGNYGFEGCTVDKCFGFGAATHTPVPK
jgi:hypothetical protein